MKSLKPKPIRRAKPAPKKSRATPAAGRYVLRLFVAGATTRSRQAILHVRDRCAGAPKTLCRLEVIDIYQQPALARAHQIVATPTLIVEFPPPLRRFIGNLANLSGLFIELDLLKKFKITV